MKKVVACTVLFVMALPVFVRADEPCGCGKTTVAKNGQALSDFPIACPLFPIDEFTWYAEYYETSCNDPPEPTWLWDPQTPSDCDPATCESGLRLAREDRSTYGSYAGGIVGHEFAPKLLDPKHAELVDQRFVSFRFQNPITNQPDEVITKVFQYRVTLKNKKEEPRSRFVAYEVKDAGPNPSVPIGSLGLQVSVDRETRTIRLVPDDSRGEKIAVLVRLAYEHESSGDSPRERVVTRPSSAANR